jgi:hypothetical protein
MASTTEERLFEIYTAYKQARDRRPADLKEAKSEREVEAVMRNVDKLHAAYLKAAKVALDATGQAVEDALKSARAARKKVDDAYQQAKKLPERIRAVADLASSVGKLLTTASKI